MASELIRNIVCVFSAVVFLLPNRGLSTVSVCRYISRCDCARFISLVRLPLKLNDDQK